MSAVRRFSARFSGIPRLTASLAGLLVAAHAVAGDPLSTARLHASAPAAGMVENCRVMPAGQALTLGEVIEQALCNNPQTHLAWANARAQAAQVGIARGAYLPTLSASVGRNRNVNEAANGTARTARNQTAAGLNFSLLLFDFGGREAALESAMQLMAALAASENAVLQSVFLAAVQAYYQSLAAEAAVVAARESERASLESLKAAEARYRIGSGTPADSLQAQTAAAQATLVRIQAEGNARTALGVLANTLGLDAHRAPTLAAPAESGPEAGPEASFEGDIAELIAAAKRQRPDLTAAEAQLRAAEAGIQTARASGLPSISLAASGQYQDNSLPDATRGHTVGINVSIPLFSGFSTTYRVRAAEAQRDARLAQRDQLDRQVSLDVWRAYFSLLSGTEAVRATTALLASAEQSARVATGRYRAGVGGILELLNAQSALANARQQHIQAYYNWRIARATLAQAMGKIDFDWMQGQAKP